MQLIIENKTDICQLVWISSVACSDSEEVVLLRARERKCLETEVSSRQDVTVWDRSPAFPLCQKDIKRMRQHFAISMVS